MIQNLKKLRLKNIERSLYFEKSLWHFYEGSLEDYDLLEEIFNKNNPKIVVNLLRKLEYDILLKIPFHMFNLIWLALLTFLKFAGSFLFLI